MSRRLSPLETIMWRVGHDPVLTMSVGTLLLLDRSPGRSALVERLASAVEQAPRLTWRPDDPSRSHVRPSWVEDDDLELGPHVRELAVPAPGDLRQVLDLAALLLATPFAAGRPPWDVTLIDGLDGERAALFLRADHVVTDGLGGRSLTTLLLDEGPAATGVATVASAPAAEVADGAVLAGPAGPGRRPGTLTLTIDLAKAARPVATGLSAVTRLNPVDAVVRRLQRGLETASSVSRQLVVVDGPYADLPTGDSATSRFEALSVPGARRAALALGGSRNDLLVAATASGLGRYLEHAGQTCTALRMAAPAGRVRPGGFGGNSFAPIRLVVPTGTEHPGPQFGVVAERLAAARHEPAARLTDTLAAAISRLPARLLVPALHAQAGSIDFVASALPGLRGPRQLCGATITAGYPFGPRLGSPVNVTAFGNDDRLDIGIAVDPVAVADPEALVECLASSFRLYAPAAGAEGPQHGPERRDAKR
jgi:WS/DGAT/MGAT family acyltransferase